MGDNVCGACDQNVEVEKGDYLIQCSNCTTVYHDKDSGCSTVTNKSWRESGTTYRKTWVGVCCRKRKMSNPSNSSTKHQRRNVDDDEDWAAKMSKILDSKLDPFVKKLDERMEEMCANIKNNTESLGLLTSRVKKIEDNITEGVASGGADSETVKLLQQRVCDLEYKLEASENYSRRENLVFTGIPMQGNEDPFEVAVKAAEIVNVKIERRDIVDCHRLPSSGHNDSSPSFIVKFVCRHQKRIILESYRQVKPTAARFGGDANVKIFANEHLAPYTSKLYREARKSFGPKKVECKNGIVYCYEYILHKYR